MPRLQNLADQENAALSLSLQELLDVLTKAELTLPRDVFRRRNLRHVAGYADTIRQTDMVRASSNLLCITISNEQGCFQLRC